MKFLALTFVLFFSVQLEARDTSPVETGDLELRAALVPSGYNASNQFIGYDNNDPVLITVLGILPSTCHRVGPYKVDVKGDEVIIHQSALEYKDSGKMCITTRMPFANHIDVGILERASLNYKVIDGKTKKAIGKLPIAESPVSTPDSDLYLSVTDARLWFDASAKDKKWRVVVVGKYNSACTKIKKVHVDILEKERSIVVRPVLEKLSTIAAGTDCEPRERIQRSEPLDLDLKGIWLLHVRSVQGAGKHELVDTQSYRTP